MKAALAIILSVLVLWALVGYKHARGHLRIMEDYLQRARPDVVAAIEAYRRENGGYPDFLTNAIPRYYSGKQEQLHFLEAYHYRNLGTNYYLKHFPSNQRSALDAGSRLPSAGPVRQLAHETP